MKTRRALITGISGQDGAYLAQYLLTRDYTVIGAINPKRKSELTGLKTLGIFSKIEQAKIDVTNADEVHRFFRDNKVDDVYHLAAQSSVAASFYNPAKTLQYNIISVINLLESIRTLSQSVHFYNASSSEMYGNVSSLPITLSTPFNPLSSYAVSKVAAHQIVKSYRESYGLFACNGILFNHESPRRGSNFVTNKVVKRAVEISLGKADKLVLGNLDSKRDWGHSKDYMKAIIKMMDYKEARNWIIATGKSHSVRDLCTYVFEKLNLDPEKYVTQNPKFMRPEELKYLCGDSSETRKTLKWEPEYTFETMLDEMIEKWQNHLS